MNKNKIVILKLTLFFTFLVAISNYCLTQVYLKKSSIIRFIDGKEYYIHSVEKGHTLYSLAKIYEIPIDEIIYENPGSKDQIYVGQELKIPMKSRDEYIEKELKNDGDEFFYHIVKEGETMDEIARIYTMSHSDLRVANKLIFEPLKTGQYIKIPVNAKQTVHSDKDQIKNDKEYFKDNKSISSETLNEKKQQYYHIVKQGDNLFLIASKYNVSIEEIKNENPSLNNQLYLGQYIKIPEKKKTEKFFYHRVKQSTKLYKIANQFHVSKSSIININPGIKEEVRAGKVIKIPLKLEPEIVENEKDDNVWQYSLDTNIITKDSNLLLLTSFNEDSLRCLNYNENNEFPLKVALMIPFFLEDFDNLEFRNDIMVEDMLRSRPFEFIQFYYGVRMALDSLATLGRNIQLSVYDVDHSIGKTIKVLQDTLLQKQDLIIGPFYSRSFKLASYFSKIFEIPIINPLAERNEIIEGNPYVFKCQPNKHFQITWIKNLIKTNFKNAKIFFVKHLETPYEKDFPLYYSEINHLLDTGYYISNDEIFDLIVEKSLKDTSTLVTSEAYELNNHENELFFHDYELYFQENERDSFYVEDNFLSSITIEGKQIITDSIEFNLYDSTYIENQIVSFYYSIDSIYSFENNASIYRDNIVVVFTDDNVFALDLMTKLNILRDTFSITVVGLPNWQQFENMDYEIMDNLNVHVLSPNFVDYSDTNTNRFIYQFRNQYLTEPTEYAFKGFDISWYFLNAFLKFGRTIDDCLPYYSSESIQSKMNFKKYNKADGYENSNWRIIKYDNHSIKEIKVEPPDLY